MTSVAVYSDATGSRSKRAFWQTGVHVGPPPATESYLNMIKLVEVASVDGGGGNGVWLLRRARLSRGRWRSRTTWIGPIRAMERWVASGSRRSCMAGVPMTPGTVIRLVSDAGVGSPGTRFPAR